MARVPQKKATAGSQRDLQILINEKPWLIDNAIKEVFPEIKGKINWKSPLSKDRYAEYRDEEFIKKIGLKADMIDLYSFWPGRGPQWDALAVTDDGKIILVEAKANIKEIFTSIRAQGKSLCLIKDSFQRVQNDLKIQGNDCWADKFYQYANRLAHLWFLRVKHKKSVFLLFVYFIGDQSVDGPQTKEEWEAALKVMRHCLDFPRKHKLSRYIVDIFLDVNS